MGPSLNPGTHRVYPDGCIDLMYIRANGKSQLDLIGAMTQYIDAHSSPGTEIFAIRFHPGGFHLAHSTPPADQYSDQAVDLHAIHPHDARLLKTRLDNATGREQMAAICSSVLPTRPPDPIHQAIAEITRSRGAAGLDWFASQANLSSRHFRRHCLARTGLTPKQLARIVRFRHALRRLKRSARGDLTNLALECGYYDQAHFIHEFRTWTGLSPVRFLQSRIQAPPLHSNP